MHTKFPQSGSYIPPPTFSCGYDEKLKLGRIKEYINQFLKIYITSI